MAPIRPSTLTAKQAEHPYRRTTHETLGSVSVLERSFGTGKLEEIEYWIARGVVQEALGGAAGGRVDYARSLMDHLCHWLGETALDARNPRMRAVLDLLWQTGGNTKPDAWKGWLAGASAWPLADTLLDLGTDPWEGGKQVVGKDKHKKDTYPMACGGMVALRQLVTRQNVRYGRERLDDTVLIARVDRMLALLPNGHYMAGLALGVVTEGGILAGMREQMTDPNVQQQEDPGSFACWARWRDLLLDKGARVDDEHSGALAILARCAPHKPLDRWEVLDRIYATAKQGNGNGIPGQLLEQTVLQDALEGRARGWTTTAHAWLDRLLPEVGRGQDSTNRTDAGQSFTLARLLDAPDGLTLAGRIFGALAQQGWPITWIRAEGGYHPWSDRSVEDVICVDGKRSMRRLRQIMALGETSGVPAAGAAWRRQATNEFLRHDAGESNDDALPSMRIKQEGKYTRRRLPWSSQGRIKAAPTLEEIDALLDLAGPQLVPKDGPNVADWLDAFMSALPGQWMLSKAKARQQDAMLDLLAQRGVLTHLLERAEPLMALGNSQDRKTRVSGTHLSMLGWISSWSFHDTLLARMDQALARLGPLMEHDRARLQRAGAWMLLHHHPEQQHTHDRDGFMGKALQRECQDSHFLAGAADLVMARLENSRADTQWKNLESSLQTLHWIQTLGWAHPLPQEFIRLVKTAVITRETPTEGQQELVWQVLSHGQEDAEQLKAIAQQLLDGLLGAHADGNVAMNAWEYLAVRLVALGANGSPAPGNTERANLADVVSLAMKRRDLAALADGTETPEAPGGRMNRRF